MIIEIKPTPEKTGYRVKITEPLESRFGEVNKITSSPIFPGVLQAIFWIQHKIYLDSIASHPMGGINTLNSKGKL